MSPWPGGHLQGGPARGYTLKRRHLPAITGVEWQANVYGLAGGPPWQGRGLMHAFRLLRVELVFSHEGIHNARASADPSSTTAR